MPPRIPAIRGGMNKPLEHTLMTPAAGATRHKPLFDLLRQKNTLNPFSLTSKPQAINRATEEDLDALRAQIQTSWR